jgi:ATP-dependent Clp protease ATP-binding subunit ClpC
MSGFVSEFSITELKGAPPGYVGYGRSGWLVKAIKDNPQSIVLFKKINVAHPNIQQFIIESCRNGKMTNSAEQEVKLNNAVIIFSITLSEKEMDKILDKSSKIMGFGNEKDKKDTNLRERIDEFIGQDLSKAIDEVILFNRLEDTDLEKIYNFNLTKQLNLYENINIDLDELKKNVLKDSKNGRDIINKLSSLVPNMIFKNLLEGEKINEVNKVKVSTKHSKDHKKRTNKGPVSKANYRPCEPDEDCSKSESKS